MIYVLASNGQVEVFPYSISDLRVDNPNTSFPEEISDSVLADFNVYPVVEITRPAYDPITQNIDYANPILEGGQWIEQWSITPASPDEIVEREFAAKQSNAERASLLLSDTDWVELGDVDNPANPPYLANKAAFTAYRQQLRVIAINPPITVDAWPVKPEEVWGS